MNDVRIFWADEYGPHDLRLDNGDQIRMLDFARVIHDNPNAYVISMWEIPEVIGEYMPEKWDWPGSE